MLYLISVLCKQSITGSPFFCIGYDTTLRRLGEEPSAGIPSKSYNQSGPTTIIDRERVVQTRVDLLYKTKGKV